MFKLPFELFYEMRQFANINALFNTCRVLRQIGNKTVTSRTLIKKEGALKYLRDSAFRSRVYHHNLSLCLNAVSNPNISVLSNIHTLDLSWCTGITDVSALSKVHTLDLSWCNSITDVSALGNVHTLKLACCKGITDVSALGKVHTLDLTCCTGITDVSALGNIHTLNLTCCTSILGNGLSALGNVHTLYLESGSNRIDEIGRAHV